MNAAATALPQLITLENAVKGDATGVLSVQMLRAWIKRGELPASKAGKSYLIDPADLAARLAPRLRPSAAKPSRETPSQRERRQLAEAGIVAPK